MRVRFHITVYGQFRGLVGFQFAFALVRPFDRVLILRLHFGTPFSSGIIRLSCFFGRPWASDRSRDGVPQVPTEEKSRHVEEKDCCFLVLSLTHCTPPVNDNLCCSAPIGLLHPSGPSV